jgi:hypothetical protein
VIAFLIQGIVRPGYDAVQQPVSSLAIGRSGWVQRANFVGTGLLMCGLAVGLDLALRPYGISLLASVLVGAYAIGLIGAGIFVTDPFNSAATELGQGEPPSLEGTLHAAFSIVVFLALPAACLVVAVGFLRAGWLAWATYSFVSGVLFATGFVFMTRRELGHIFGLVQRATIIVGWAWLTVLATYLLTARE